MTAITNERLIQHYSEIHTSGNYGSSGDTFALPVRLCLHELRPGRVLEYGCGRSNLVELCAEQAGSAEWVRYDPAIPEFSAPPEGMFDLIINTDVMEHIPFTDLDAVLGTIRRHGERVFFNISTRLAGKTLPDGTNAHCTVLPPHRWLECLRPHFPDTRIVHADAEDSVLLLTWPSEMAYAVGGIADLRARLRRARKGKARGPLRQWFKKRKEQKRRKRASAAGAHIEH